MLTVCWLYIHHNFIKFRSATLFRVDAVVSHFAVTVNCTEAKNYIILGCKFKPRNGFLIILHYWLLKKGVGKMSGDGVGY